MPPHSDLVIDHFRQPRNVGALDVADAHVGAGTAGSAECSSMIRVHLRIAPDGRISEARFKAYGCGCTIAAASRITERLIGQTADEALAVTSAALAAELSLGSNKAHCAALAVEAVRNAVADVFRKRPR